MKTQISSLFRMAGTMRRAVCAASSGARAVSARSASEVLLASLRQQLRAATCGPLRPRSESRSGTSALLWRIGLVILVALTLFAPPRARAQGGIGDIVYTVGTVTDDAHGRHWAYLLWQGTQPGLISNRVFAVYAKPGDPTNNAPY